MIFFKLIVSTQTNFLCSFVDKILPFDFESVRNISKEFEYVEPVIISPSLNDKSGRTP